MSTADMALLSRDDGPIGPAGITARVLVGSTLIAFELLWRDAKWWDPFVGLGMAALVTVVMAVRARRVSAPLDATGPVPHVLTVALAGLLIYLPPTSGGALLFYGGSMLVAAARRQCGCEMTVISNATLGRDDQVACALFAPVDLLERLYRQRSTPRAAAPSGR
ncbi:MAG TPA: hypothetical protein VK326_01755 [Solirubrobacterales bacterium]|nr:hypothetical protein [Solirubrobacterales bacterium]